MKILFCRWHSLCEPDMIQAWISLGHTVIEFNENIDDLDYGSVYLNKLSKWLQETAYDIIFSVDFIPVAARVCKIFHIRYVSYSVDCPVMQFYSNAVSSEWNRIFIFDKEMYYQFRHKNPDHIFYLPLAANINHMERMCRKITSRDRKRFSAEVSFIGSLYKEKCPYNHLKLPKQLKGYLDGVIEAQLKVYGRNFLEEALTDEAVELFRKHTKMAEYGPDYDMDYRAVIAQEFLGVKCSELERVRFMEGISKEYDVDFYTQSDTSNMPSVHNRGSAESRIEMPRIFHLSKINLNFTLKSIRTGLPQRIWDILACGGFLLTNYQPELTDYFEIGGDLAVYESLEDLKEKIEFYLKHEDIRRQIAENGNAKVRKYHSYKKRVEMILKVLESETNQQTG